MGRVFLVGAQRRFAVLVRGFPETKATVRAASCQLAVGTTRSFGTDGHHHKYRSTGTACAPAMQMLIGNVNTESCLAPRPPPPQTEYPRPAPEGPSNISISQAVSLAVWGYVGLWRGRLIYGFFTYLILFKTWRRHLLKQSPRQAVRGGTRLRSR